MARFIVVALVALAFIVPSNGIKGRFESRADATVYLNNYDGGGRFGTPPDVQPPPPSPGTTHRTMETAVWLPHRAADVTKVGLAAHATPLDVVFSIKQNNLDALDAFVQQASDPRSPLFGRRKTRDEVAAWTANLAGRDTVVAFVTAAGADIVAETRYGEYITARGTAGLWSALLGTQFYVYRAAADAAGAAAATEFVRAEAYSIPEALQPHVAAVFNTVQMPASLHRPATGIAATIAPVPSDRGGNGGGRGLAASSAALPSVTPAALRHAYGARPASRGSPLAAVAIYASLGQSFSPSDLRAFANHFHVPAPNVTVVAGGHRSDAACAAAPHTCAEANLDVQWAAAVGQGAAIEVCSSPHVCVSRADSPWLQHSPHDAPTCDSTGTTPARPSPTGPWPWPTPRARRPCTACRTACPRPT
jgi:subtilase family serine protease